VPHEAVRGAPQLSVPITVPQFFCRRLQNVESGSGWQLHALPLHVCGSVHEPQLIVRGTPQLSNAVTEPHVAPLRAQNAACDSLTHEHTPLEQVLPAPHVTLAEV
jgi:hypothetical protein